MSLFGLLVPLVVPMEGGILDFITGKSSQTTETVKNVAIAVAVIFFLWKAIEAKFAVGRIIMSLLAVGLVVWGVYNVMTLKDRVDSEINSAPQPGHTVQIRHPGPPPGDGSGDATGGP